MKKICSRLLISRFAIEIFLVYDQSRSCIHIASIHALGIRNVSHFLLYVIRWNILRRKKKFFFSCFNRSINSDTGLTISCVSLIHEINHHDSQIHCVYRGNWQHWRKIIAPWKSCLTTFKLACVCLPWQYTSMIFLIPVLERSIYPYPYQWLII